MVVDLNNNEAVVSYVRHQAAHGIENVIGLVRGDRDAMMELIGDLTDEEAGVRIDNGAEYSVTMIIQHLNMSFERSQRRLWTLASGQPFVAPAGAGRGGGLPEELNPSFDMVRREFKDGEDGVLEILERADPGSPSEITASHAQYGPFTWLQWAVYSHHVHTSDHVKQVRQIKSVLRD